MTKSLTQTESDELIETLKSRFENNIHRHENINWQDVARKLADAPAKLWSLNEMEKTGGEPDIVGYDEEHDAFIFIDCSPESPTGRRSACYDREGLDARKKHKPEHNAIELASKMGIEMLTEEQYRELQKLGEFDLKTSSWVQTPPEIRKLGGALFCDRRYDHVFTYHNGASSYYAARGFRGQLRL